MNELSTGNMTVSFAESMQSGILMDAGIDYAEIGLDQLYDILFLGAGSPLLREIPIVKTVIAAGKTIHGIASVFRIKKLLAFLQTLHEGKPDESEVLKRVEAAKHNEKWFIREAEEIVIYLERQTSAKKSQMLARIYLDYILGKIPYRYYIEYLDILDQLFLCDISQIIEFYDFEFHDKPEIEPEKQSPGSEEAINVAIRMEAYGMIFEPAKRSRLAAMGLLYESDRTQPGPLYSQYKLTGQGKYFAQMAKSLHYQSMSQENGNVY